MHLYILLLLCLLPVGLHAQTAALLKQGRWVSTELNSLVFRNDQVLDAVFEDVPEHSNYVFKGDTLVLVKTYYSSVDNFAFERSDSAKFFIKAATTKNLVLVPVDENARNLARKPEYRYTSLSYTPAEKVKFNTLTFSTVGGNGADKQINIDQHGNVYAGPTTANGKPGALTGKLTRAQSDTLQTLLQHSLLSRLKAWSQNVVIIDVPTSKLDITTTNGQIYHWQGEVTPVNLEPLIEFLLGLSF